MVGRDTPETQYAFCGAVAIHQELDKLGYRNKPALSTINRVLKRNGLITQKVNAKKNKTNQTYFPQIRARHPGYLHQLDLVTPRYINGFGVVVSVNRIDVFSAQANLDQYQNKGAENVISFLTEDWKIFGIPHFLQLDNESSFRGSLFHSRTFGKLTRFCLNFGVEIVFIPFNEPWRNAHIESFNSRFDKMLWQSVTFKNLEHLRLESKKFRDKHNNYQEYRKNNFVKQTPRSYETRYLPESFQFDESEMLPITKGRLHFIRMIKENGTINILNEEFYIDRQLSFEYVWATIDTTKSNLTIWYQPTKDSPKELLHTKSYQLRERVKDNISTKTFC